MRRWRISTHDVLPGADDITRENESCAWSPLIFYDCLFSLFFVVVGKIGQCDCISLKVKHPELLSLGKYTLLFSVHQ